MISPPGIFIPCIGSRTLASYTYTSQNNYLDTLVYGNGDSVQYTYDQQGRVTKQTYEDNATVTYRYDNDGALANVVDSSSGISTTYYYDFIDRMMKYVETGGTINRTVGYEYDTINNLTKMVETIDGREYPYTYTYDDDNRVTSVLNTAAGRDYHYDSCGRIMRHTTKHGNTTVKTDNFAFTAPTSTDTCFLIAAHSASAASYYKHFAYTYDDNGNILSITSDGKTVSYVYDSANQLIRENNQAANKTTTWTYDKAGNIQSRKEYAYTTGALGTPSKTVPYTYGDSSWGDLLKAYDGVAISYDNIGNPLSDGTRTYSWKHGRQLATIASGGTTWTNTYNADGIRVKRTNGSTTYNYAYNGDKLSYMTVGSNRMYFTYDAQGTPIAIRLNDANYYYVSNIQGDIIAILNSTGTTVVEYTYDAWGNVLKTEGTMASTLGTLNPLRYRAYVYDSEYGLYYLQSRYYNPETGRFLNADAFAATGQGILGNNMFAYCDNSPVANLDSHGDMKQRIKEFYVAGAGGGGAAAGLGAGLFALIHQFAKDTSDLIAQAKAQAAAKRRESQSRNYTVYFLKAENDSSNNIVYVGRVKTLNFDARMTYHNTRGREHVYSISNLTYTECRLLEQAGMSYYHSINRGNDLYNQIRGISIKNGSTFLEAVKVFVDSANYVDNTYLPLSYITNQYENWLLNG